MSRLASVLGALAVAGVMTAFLVAKPHRRHGITPGIKDQFIDKSNKVYETVRGPRLRIDVWMPNAVTNVTDEDNVECRIVDASGRQYAGCYEVGPGPRTLFVPLTYGRPVVSPRLEVWTSKGEIGETPLADFPLPVIKPLAARRDRRIEAHHATVRRTAEPGIAFEPRVPLARGEDWTIKILQTPLQVSSDFNAYLGTESSTQIPFAEDIDAVRIRVQQSLHCEHAEKVVIANLRLVKRGGQTVLLWPEGQIPNTLGLSLSLKRSSQPYRTIHTDRSGDQKAPTAEFSIKGANPGYGPGFKGPEVEYKIDPAAAHRLNLVSLEIGQAVCSGTNRPSNPVSASPFSLMLTITKRWIKPLGSFEATIPVEPARTP